MRLAVQRRNVPEAKKLFVLVLKFISRIKTLCFRVGKAELLRSVEREGRVGERGLGATPRPALLAEIRAGRGNIHHYQGTCSIDHNVYNE